MVGGKSSRLSVIVSLDIFIRVCCCRWSQIYRKMSSFAGKPTALNGIRCVESYQTARSPSSATDGGDGVHNESGNGR